MLKVLFYGDRCSDAIELFPVMKILRGFKGVECYYSSLTEQAAIDLAKRNDFPITLSCESFDILAVVKIHKGHSLWLSKQYYNSGKPVVLIQHVLDTYANLLSEYRDEPIDFFTTLCAGGPIDYKLLRSKFKDKVIMTGIPRLDKLCEAPYWDKKEIRELVKSNKYWLITMPGPNVLTSELESQFFIELPKLIKDKLDSEPIYKIHPNHDPKPFYKYGYTIIDDDTKTKDITYELINASEGIITTIYPSFMAVEASILRKPVICYGNEILPGKTIDTFSGWRLTYLRKFVPLIMERWRPFKISSTFEMPSFNEHQQQLTDEFLHDGKNSQRVAEFILEIGKEIRGY